MTKHGLKIATIVIAITSLFISAEGKETTLYRNADKQKMNEWVDFTFNALTPRERISQLMIPMIVPDKTDNFTTALTPLIKDNKVGGLLISKGSTTSYVKLINEAQKMSKTPLLITIDGEWGTAMRVTDALPFPRNMVIGAIDDDKLIYEYGKEVARQCKVLGIHVNFAPVLDINVSAENTVIGTRSFGENPNVVSRKGIAYAKGLEDGGVLSVAKHFPGHGSTTEDSHKTLPVINKTFSDIDLVDAYPFKKYIDAGLGGILVGHLDIPCFKQPGTPATYNSNVVKKYLADKLDFNGLIFTDALEMQGAAGEGSSAVKALKAGNDVLLSPQNINKEIDEIEKAIANGEISQSDIDSKCKKILRYKYILGANNPQILTDSDIKNKINSEESKILIDKLKANSITVFKNQDSFLPIKSLNDISIFSPNGDTPDFVSTCKLYTEISVLPTIEDIDSSSYKTIIIPVTKYDSNSLEALTAASNSNKSVVAVFFINPYEVRNFASVLNKNNVYAVEAYQNDNKTQSYAAQAIFGGISVSGKLPVTIADIATSGSGISYEATRLGFSTPQEAGVNNRILNYVDSIVTVGLNTKAFPGCQVLMVKDNKVFCNKAYGVTDPDIKDPVTTSTLYDLASVSKATGTLSGIMKIYDSGLLDLSAPASNYEKGLRRPDKKNITITDLLYHESGMRPSLNLYYIMLDSLSYESPLFKNKKDNTYTIPVAGGIYGNKNAKLRSDILSPEASNKFSWKICEGLYGNKSTYDTVMACIYTSKLLPTKKYTYSCLNFALLMDIEQNITKKAHNKFVQKEIFEPIGAYRTVYHPCSYYALSEIAPTEADEMLRKQKMHGYVHDELACFSGGVQGNAGLFSNAMDLAKFCQLLLNNGTYGGVKIYSPNTVKLFTTSKSPNSRRGLGFDKPDKSNENNSPTCEGATAATFGHTGFTGTCFWVDPTNNMIFIFLSNRVNPSRDNEAFSDLEIRSKLFQAFYDNIEK